MCTNSYCFQVLCVFLQNNVILRHLTYFPTSSWIFRIFTLKYTLKTYFFIPCYYLKFGGQIYCCTKFSNSRFSQIRNVETWGFLTGKKFEWIAVINTSRFRSFYVIILYSSWIITVFLKWRHFIYLTSSTVVMSNFDFYTF